MTSTITTIICIFFSSCLFAQSLLWTKTMGGNDNETAQKVKVDQSGNVYTIGIFSDTISFNSGSEVFVSAGNYDIFISKFDSNGAFLWARQIGGSSADLCSSLAIDNLGDIYFTGKFDGAMDFDPSINTAILSSYGNLDIFIEKLDANGNFVWVKQIGSTGPQEGVSVVIDQSNNVCVTGGFAGTVDFDPNVGVSTLTSSGGIDIFVVKLNSAGDFIWAKKMGGASNERARVIACDAIGNIFTTGTLSAPSPCDFDPGVGVFNLTSNGADDVFISKLDSLGNFVWANSLGSAMQYDNSNNITVDLFGDVLITGDFYDVVDFDPGMSVYNLTSLGGTDIFILKLTNAGNFVWAKNIGATSSEYAIGTTTDQSGNIYVNGSLPEGAPVDFDLNTGVYNLSSTGLDDVFILKLDVNGAFIWAQSFGGLGYDGATSIDLDALGNIYTSGYFDQTADFNPNSDLYNIIPVANQDAYIHKMSQTAPAFCIPAQPAVISGNTVLSPNTTEVYTVATVPNTTEYHWSLPLGWIGSSTTNTITVFVGDSSGTVSVVAQNNCGISSSSSILVNVCTVPAQPSIISGNTSVVAGASETYSVAPVVGATSYIWTLPSGWSGSSTSNSISVLTNANSGIISITAVNGCGSSLSSTLAVVVSSNEPISDCSPALFKDIRPGFLDSYPINFRELNGTLYFSTYDGLWKTNGTETGTTQIESFSDIKEIEVLNNNLIFCVPSPNWQLRKSDGTSTTLIKDFPNASSFDGIANLTPVNGLVFFVVNENYVKKLWRTDGTEAGTILVKDIDPTNNINYAPGGLFAFNNNVYFKAGNSISGTELWKSNGTEFGTTMVKDLFSGLGSGHSTPVYAILNNELYFYGNDGSQYGLWKTDGSDAGTVFIKECIWIGEMSTINNVLYFSAYDIGANTGNTLYGEELWISDGTPTGTYMVKDIYPGQSGSKHNNYQFKPVNSTVVFSAKDGVNGVELWKTDGTETGTTLLKNINPDVINAQIGLSSSVEFNGYLYFSANNGTTGGELWKTDGTEAGTALVADLYPGTDGSSPFEFTVFNGSLFFRAESASAGVELWSCVALTSSISDAELSNNISVYPNPSTGVFNIKTNATLKEASVKVYGIYGQMVFESNKITSEIDLSNQPAGVYFIQLKSGTTFVNKKIVLQ